ncbi:uncharacterized protein LOC116109666 isoform X1 [Pistacia vera]|uniref:uncharacterized protein LOC116109666 isoform X1 n=1 Tax=Pistacia vera TaxID=55513 RepID=UPI001262CC63|nr:uncharacterized protein LOC116109666 isoform X1 [Pistacia vera]
MGLTSVLWEIFNKSTMGDVLRELIMFIAPLWIVVIVGILVGWAWKPKWINLGCRDLVDASLSKVSNSSSIGLASIPSLNFLKFQFPTCISGVSDDGLQTNNFNNQSTISSDSGSEIFGQGRRTGREVCEEGNNNKEVEEMKIEPIEEKSKLKFDFEKPNHDDGIDNACKPPKPGVPKVEKTVLQIHHEVRLLRLGCFWCSPKKII